MSINIEKYWSMKTASALETCIDDAPHEAMSA